MIITLSTNELITMILTSNKRLYVCLPGIHSEVSNAIIEKKKKGFNHIHVIVDLTEDSIRNGYGELDTVMRMKKSGIPIYYVEGIRVSFIIFDNRGYILFPESKIFKDETNGLNAIEIDILMQLRIINHLFPPVTDSEQKAFELEVINGITNIQKSQEEIMHIKRVEGVKVALEKDINAINFLLSKDPPIHPDLQRQIKTYNSKIQFVEFHFEGQNIQTVKVNIPADALPFKDKNIKKSLEARMKLFESIENNKEYELFFSLKKEVDDLRKKYLIPITSREKSIIRKDNKPKFDENISLLNEKLKTIHKHLINLITKEILNAKDRLKKELFIFIKEQPPESYNSLKEEPELFDRVTDDVVNRIISRIKFPDPNDLLDKMDLSVYYYDLTWDDFENELFLSELEDKKVFEKGAFDKIINLRNAFAVKENVSEE